MTEVSVKVGLNKITTVNNMIAEGYRLVKMSVEDGSLTMLFLKDQPTSSLVQWPIEQEKEPPIPGAIMTPKPVGLQEHLK